MEKEKNSEEDYDRISNLPEVLIHQILSYLPVAEAGRTTVLSKTWLQSYSSFPNLTFHERFFCSSAKYMEKRYPFFNFVINTLLRYTSRSIRIHKFEITVIHVKHAPANNLLDKLLEMALDNGVEKLDINVEVPIDEFSPYTLPSSMFDSPKLLTCLSVDHCKFPQYVVSNSQCNAINFPFLQTLIIHRAYIDDGMLQKLLSSCPSLEKIEFFLVCGFKKLRVSNLDKLNILYIRSDKTIDIDLEDAPSLHLLQYSCCSVRPCSLKVDRVLQKQGLKRLELCRVSINDNSLNELITKLPLLEHLEVYACDEFERINILSYSLKHLKFRFCKNLVEAKIDTPSLLELAYFGENVLSISLNNTPQELMTYIYIHLSDNCQVSDAWFRQLRFLQKSVTRARVSFTLWNLGISFDTTLDLRENPLPRTENYKPEMNPSSLFAVFVNMIFSNFRPTSIASCTLRPAFVDFMKFLSSELITATRNSNCCSYDQTKCWRHYLKDIKVEVYDDSLKGWQLLHPETSLSEFAFGKKKICFSLKWYANLNAQV